MIYYVIYAGIGRDGGFGDYAGAYWEEEPVKIDDKIIWFQWQKHAEEVVEHLNRVSWETFSAAGHGESYSGEFPIEYEWRKIIVPTGDHISDVKAIELITEAHGKNWSQGDFYDDWGDRSE